MVEQLTSPAEIKKPLRRQAWMAHATGAIALAAAVGMSTAACSGEGEKPPTVVASEVLATPSASEEPPTPVPETMRKLAKYGNYSGYVEATSERQNTIAGNHERLRWLAKFACFVSKEPYSSEAQWGATMPKHGKTIGVG